MLRMESIHSLETTLWEMDLHISKEFLTACSIRRRKRAESVPIFQVNLETLAGTLLNPYTFWVCLVSLVS